MSKGSGDRTNAKKYRKNYPIKDGFEPNWKKELRKLRNEKK